MIAQYVKIDINSFVKQQCSIWELGWQGRTAIDPRVRKQRTLRVNGAHELKH
ncbi:MAG: hypothetical protein WCK35_05280 [Chloroflexota bacterium]